MANTPYTGADTPLFYCEELIDGVTPDNPVWIELRTTSGMPIIERELTESQELNARRDSSKPRASNKQVTGEIGVEYSASSQDSILSGAMMSTWEEGETESALSITVNAAAKTFTRAAGDFTVKVQVGDYIAFTNLTGENAKPFFVTNVTATVITGAEIAHKLTDETKSAVTYKTAAILRVGSECKTYSILAIMNGMCGSDTEYVISRGVRFIGFNLEAAVSSMITGSSTMIGKSQEVLDTIPAGTFPPSINKPDPFHAVDAVAYEQGVRLEHIDNFTITNDNSATAQFELGNEFVSSVSMSKAKNSFSASGKVASLGLYKKALGETSSTFKVAFANNDGALAFKLNNCTFTVKPERGDASDITQSIEGQAAIADNGDSSLMIYRITY